MSFLERFIMGSIIKLKFGEKNIRLFTNRFGTGEYLFGKRFVIHRHRYTEIHIIISGEAVYTVNDTEYHVSEGDGIVIPAKAYHKVEAENSEKIVFSAFQLDIACEKVNHIRLNENIFKSYVQSLKADDENMQTEKTAMYALWFISELCYDMPVSVLENKDIAYYIFEYISTHYNQDISVEDAARELNLSTKQMQRIIKRETGRTFLSELTAHRMRIAEYLMRSSEMSLNDIAVHVGYNSYSGFWKAWQKYRMEKENKT